jgi:hypothetical protein
VGAAPQEPRGESEGLACGLPRNGSGMGERQRLLSLLEVYDHAIDELYVLSDGDLLDLILRLERRRREALQLLGVRDGDDLTRVSGWVAQELESSRAPGDPSASATH